MTAMTFEQKYRALEDRFRSQVARDEERWGEESVYLPSAMPSGQVDYVLVAMEPSAGRKSKDEIQKRIDEGYRNFCNSTGDFILHYCARNYLCRDEETYHVTDLAKGTLKTESAAAGSEEKYEAWYPLLVEELSLVAPNAGVIAVGKQVGKFFSERGLRGHVCTILHYSQVASSHRKRAICGREEEYMKFASCLNEVPSVDSRWVPQEPIPLTESDKMLAFTYKVSFEDCRRHG